MDTKFKTGDKVVYVGKDRVGETTYPELLGLVGEVKEVSKLFIYVYFFDRMWRFTDYESLPCFRQGLEKVE